MNEAFGGPLYQMLNPGAQQIVDRMGIRGGGVSDLLMGMAGPGGKIKLSKAALKKIKPLLQERKRQLKFAENYDPNESAAAQNAVKRIEKQIDRIIANDQS